MKKILPLIVCFIGLLYSAKLEAQTFSIEAAPSDTVWQSITGSSTIADYITNLTSGTLTIKWRVNGTNFPSDWLDSAALGICDDQYCRQNGSGQLWNGSLGTAFTAPYYANGTHDSVGDFHMQLNLSGATTTGTYYLNVSMQDITNGPVGSEIKNTTFVVSKFPTAINNINSQEYNVVLYPNPAHDEVNVVYDANADIKNIAVYNIIGKMLTVYKVTNNTSANLNLENIPSGIYFVRLFNSHGNVIDTRKFTKQ